MLWGFAGGVILWIYLRAAVASGFGWYLMLSGWFVWVAVELLGSASFGLFELVRAFYVVFLF